MPRMIPRETKYMYCAVVYRVGEGPAAAVGRFGPYRLRASAAEQITRFKKARQSWGGLAYTGHIERVALNWEREVPINWVAA